MTSLEIAELTGKPHNDVLKAIRKMEPAWTQVTQGKFSLSSYQDATGRTLPCYELTKNDSIFERLDIQFTTEQAMQQSVAVKGAGVTRNTVRQMLKNWRKQGLVVLEEDGNYRKL
jgi:Rha family phage regulatory protein